MHLERSNATIVSSNAPRAAHCRPVHVSLNNEARVRVLYNVSKRQISTIPDPKSVARPFWAYFLHTSNEKHHFFNFFSRKSNVFLTFSIQKRSNATIVSSNAPRALKRYYSKLKRTSSALQTCTCFPKQRGTSKGPLYRF